MVKQLFTSIIRLYLEYRAPVWNPYSKKLSTLIGNVQRRASKQIPGLSHFRYEERLRTMKLPTLQYLRYRWDMVELQKLTRGLYDRNTIRNFLDFRSSHSRGHQFNHKHSFKKDVRKYSFKCRTTEQWNNLPDLIVNAPSMNSFKSRLDKLWENDRAMYDPDIDIHSVTSARRIRYEIIDI